MQMPTIRAVMVKARIAECATFFARCLAESEMERESMIADAIPQGIPARKRNTGVRKHNPIMKMRMLIMFRIGNLLHVDSHQSRNREKISRDLSSDIRNRLPY
nr:MAG TPA: hypothetical protein [Caudoviricetes sp.]